MFVYAAEVAKTIRGASRYGIDAHIDRVRWDDVVSRVFGRIDPIALSGEDYRRCAPNIDVYRTHTRFGPVQADGRYLLRTDAGEEFTAEQVVIAAGSRPVIPPAILASGVDYHTSDTVMRIAELPEHIVIVGSGFIAAEFAHVFSALGVRVTLVIRAAAYYGIVTTPSANGSPASHRPNGSCAPIATLWTASSAARASRCG